ncbi:Response receiver-modulated diguanylate cyclase [Candidatus Terasakiella magnetica]|uniref:diguanylate cyclase n=1 Tax=Candidatus Terasakiella magnetica TaxID=1867952 RepID=A0A1C3RGB9_9PROT|nr:diguanylate cyclase [Candidatus Terasakiella magnetica]SCA56330.1 Response receiver-modulated diguanylate cyclase [Candidatus Terasakiella magnetica]
MNILLVESSRTVAFMVMAELSKTVDAEINWAQTTEQALMFIEENGIGFYKFAISGLTLSDSIKGDIIEKVTEYQIPTIIFTASFDLMVREKLLKIPGVVDYVVKESPSAFRYLSNLVYRLTENKKLKALVVEEVRSVRLYITELLRQYEFSVLEASSGEEALKTIEENEDIHLVVTDYAMSPMDGFELTKRIRNTHSKEEIAIIGLSESNEQALSARFIKTGANDFLIKPFQPEEFFCRVTQNIELIEKTQKLVDGAMKDFLTGVYNRRYFLDQGTENLERMAYEGKNVWVSILDIDHFKSVNDMFGHDVGDEVLQSVSKQLQESTRQSDVLARLGGEEFGIIFEDIELKNLERLLERIRARIEMRPYKSLKERRNITASFGCVKLRKGENLGDGLKRADQLLYQAKETGRNKVIIGE